MQHTFQVFAYQEYNEINWVYTRIFYTSIVFQNNSFLRAAHKKLVFFFRPTLVTWTNPIRRSSFGKNTSLLRVCFIAVIVQSHVMQFFPVVLNVIALNFLCSYKIFLDIFKFCTVHSYLNNHKYIMINHNKYPCIKTKHWSTPIF